MKKYCFRIDDISWDMNYKNFERIRDLLFKYDIRPVIGVIPNNKDEKLRTQSQGNGISEEKLWDEVKMLQKEKGWSIALHGYEHRYVNNESGMFNVNKQSEFAGLSYEEQYEKIQNGLDIFSKHNIIADAFMAPGHSLDFNTVKVLHDCEINVITDGKKALPYCKNGILFIPQINPWPWLGMWGMDTACFHVNLWNDALFERLEKYIKNHRKNIVNFDQVVSAMVKDNRVTLYGNGAILIAINNLSEYYLKGMQSLIKLGANVKHKLLR